MLPPRTSWPATDPIQYHHFMGRWSERLAPPFLAFAGVKPGDSVLDLGCGTGVLTHALAEAGAAATGIDASEPYLSGARRHPNATYELGDIRQLRFADDTFDAAVCTLVLDVLPETDLVVAEMRRVVRPGGVVAAGVHDYWGWGWYSLVWDTGAVLDPRMAALRATMKSHPLVAACGLAALWRRAGLLDVVETPLVVDCTYPSWDDYWGTFTSGQGRIPALLQQLPDDVGAEIAGHVRAGYLAGMPDGPRSFPMIVRAARGIVP